MTDNVKCSLLSCIMPIVLVVLLALVKWLVYW